MFKRKRDPEIENPVKYAVISHKLYNKVIMHIIHGGSACDFCEDRAECEGEMDIGCDDWILRWPTDEELKGMKVSRRLLRRWGFHE